MQALIFALWDLRAYLLQVDHYGDDPSKNILALGFYGPLSKAEISLLQDGDLILTQKMNSFQSWAMMYMTSSPVDHVGVYIGPKYILHQTLILSRRDPIRIFGIGTRVLVGRFPDVAEKKINTETKEIIISTPNIRLSRKEKIKFMTKSRLQLVRVAFLICVGNYPERFRWKFLLDHCIIFLVMSLASNSLAAGYISIYTVGALFINIVTRKMLLKFQLRRGIAPKLLGHPDMSFNAIRQIKGYFVTRFGQIFPV